MQIDIFITVEILVKWVRQTTREDFPENISPYIYDLLNTRLLLPKYTIEDRLDFKLFVELIIKEYEIRTRSNSIANKAIIGNPLKLNSIRNFDFTNESEASTLKFLLRLEKLHNINNWDMQTDFLFKIVQRYSSSKNTLPPVCKISMKALIIHEDKIPSIVQRTQNIPNSTRSILKKSCYSF